MQQDVVATTPECCHPLECVVCSVVYLVVVLKTIYLIMLISYPVLLPLTLGVELTSVPIRTCLCRSPCSRTFCPHVHLL